MLFDINNLTHINFNNLLLKEKYEICRKYIDKHSQIAKCLLVYYNIHHSLPKNENNTYNIDFHNKLITIEEVRNWSNWVYLNLIYGLGKDNEATTRVKLRIATCMLNKINNLSDTDKINIHLNLTRNINNELNILATEELPF